MDTWQFLYITYTYNTIHTYTGSQQTGSSIPYYFISALFLVYLPELYKLKDGSKSDFNLSYFRAFGMRH
jgi:hypothetical protein